MRRLSSSLCISMHPYLNESDEVSQLEGGANTIHALDGTGRHVDVIAKVGRVLLFQPKVLFYSGADVPRGIKCTMRTDVTYKKSDWVCSRSRSDFPNITLSATCHILHTYT